MKRLRLIWELKRLSELKLNFTTPNTGSWSLSRGSLHSSTPYQFICLVFYATFTQRVKYQISRWHNYIFKTYKPEIWSLLEIVNPCLQKFCTFALNLVQLITLLLVRNRNSHQNELDIKFAQKHPASRQVSNGGMWDCTKFFHAKNLLMSFRMPKICSLTIYLCYSCTSLVVTPQK